METTSKAKEYLTLLKQKQALDRNIDILRNEIVRSITTGTSASLIFSDSTEDYIEQPIGMMGVPCIFKSKRIPETNLRVIWYELQKT